MWAIDFLEILSSLPKEVELKSTLLVTVFTKSEIFTSSYADASTSDSTRSTLSSPPNDEG